MYSATHTLKATGNANVAYMSGTIEGALKAVKDKGLKLNITSTPQPIYQPKLMGGFKMVGFEWTIKVQGLDAKTVDVVGGVFAKLAGVRF